MKAKSMNRYINIKDVTHPHRIKMTSDDWARLDAWVQGDDSIVPTMDEIDAYRCWLFDELTRRKQNIAGPVTLQ